MVERASGGARGVYWVVVVYDMCNNDGRGGYYRLVVVVATKVVEMDVS